jgi:hypothetical protein
MELHFAESNPEMFDTLLCTHKLMKATAASSIFLRLGICCLLLAPQDSQSRADGLDAVRAAPNSHKVLFENPTVRVLEVSVPPGASVPPGTKEPFHQSRWPSLFINLDAGGEWHIRWMDPEPLHAVDKAETVESARTLPWRPATLRIELKSAPSAKDVPSWPDELDAVRAAPNSHKVLFENSMVRVLEVRVPPGTKEPFHHHRWPSIFISLDAGGPIGASRYYNKDGKVVHDMPRTDRPVKNPPEWHFHWMKPEPLHAIENTETAESSRTLPHHPPTIRVEFKVVHAAAANR